jgi:hypothetical protein
MTLVRSIFTLAFFVMCVMLVAGCAGSQGGEKSISRVGVDTPLTYFASPIETGCLAQENQTRWIQINPVSDHNIGDVFEINGITNIEGNNSISVKIYQTHFSTHPKNSPYPFTSLFGNVTVQGDHCGPNNWSFLTNTSSLLPDEYFIEVRSENQLALNRSVFKLYFSPTQFRELNTI